MTVDPAPVAQQDEPGTNEHKGLVVGAAGMMVAGSLTNFLPRLDRRKVGVAGTLIAAVCLALTGFAYGFGAVLVLQIVMGLAAGLAYACANSAPPSKVGAQPSVLRGVFGPAILLMGAVWMINVGTLMIWTYAHTIGEGTGLSTQDTATFLGLSQLIGLVGAGITLGLGGKVGKMVLNPRVELRDGPVTGDYDAREVFGDEKAIWWGRAVEVWPDYAMYQTKTDLPIPVFAEPCAVNYRKVAPFV